MRLFILVPAIGLVIALAWVVSTLMSALERLPF